MQTLERLRNAADNPATWQALALLVIGWAARGIGARAWRRWRARRARRLLGLVDRLLMAGDVCIPGAWSSELEAYACTTHDGRWVPDRAVAGDRPLRCLSPWEISLAPQPTPLERDAWLELAEKAAARAELGLPPLGPCRACGVTDQLLAGRGRWWVDADLCSSCSSAGTRAPADPDADNQRARCTRGSWHVWIPDPNVVLIDPPRRLWRCANSGCGATETLPRDRTPTSGRVEL